MGRDVGPDMAPAVPHLIACLTPTNGPSVAGWAARALGEYKFASPLIVPALRNQLASPDPDLRRACQESLGRLVPEEAAPSRS